MENNVELKNCPCCGGTVMLCKTGYLVTTGADFSLVCPECGMEFKMYVHPMSNVMCDTEQNKLRRLLGAFNKRAGEA